MGLGRPLISQELIEEFLYNVLGLEDEFVTEVSRKVVGTELALAGLTNKCTLTDSGQRVGKYRSEADRKRLRVQIFKELVQNQRLVDDDSIKLGEGGALPVAQACLPDKQAYIVIGLPASGKSTIASKIADETSSMIVDSDYAKRKLPEFQQGIGASLVHAESDGIVFGGIGMEYSMIDYCTAEGLNIVIPKIGHNPEKILKLAKGLKDNGYSVHLILVSIDRRKSTIRACKRFLKTDRYVPLSLIYDAYSNEPILTYYRIREDEVFTSYGKISTDVKLGDPYKIIHTKGDSIVKIFGQ